MSGVRTQFGCPTGWLGSMVGLLMAIKNGERSEWVVSQLALEPGDRVLEIGFGPGVDVARAASRAAFVAGIDASDVMLRQASRRNAAAIAEGRVALTRAAMPSLPFADASFDKIFSINSYQFWPEQTRALLALRRVVRPGGLVAIAVQPRNKGATDATSQETGAHIVATLRAAGFGEIRLVLKPMAPVATACAIATA
jgi:ubiquinone/menaquinone biosynthesis C-methylase UbiE